ncbi:MAG TPA: hypothetical protein PLM42_00450, partial [Methanothermobacter thermautotrophicus]|nr:hypothetical protein [Methanothermobacter thermautotrophicus]
MKGEHDHATLQIKQPPKSSYLYFSSLKEIVIFLYYNVLSYYGGGCEEVIVSSGNPLLFLSFGQ